MMLKQTNQFLAPVDYCPDFFGELSLVPHRVLHHGIF